ncbi:hypothetical protein JG688_00015665 [Phytophthora aleatoria]|uniref:Uncharacterized protein n=1 Tax=Phytophthora aleatoria TaxID=2496075 RepID=A0A8J5IJM6_9STRA|nr:hypothetical protein JG688_00015665 [Phytophthora aleatoria]
MPEDFKFPQLDALSVWRLWLGNPAGGYPPFRTLQAFDFVSSNRKMYSEWSVLVRHIITGVESDSGADMQRPDYQEETDRLYEQGMSKVPLEASAQPHKQQLERAVTTLRRIREAIHDANPRVRSVPFRHRKRKKQQ